MKKSEITDDSNRGGFTRVDLMACLAVAGVLLTLAASGVSSSKDNVNRMVCASNMRQLALAVGMYANDNQDYLPYCNWDGGSQTDPAPGWLYTLPIPKGLVGSGQLKIPDPFAPPWNANKASTVSAFSDSAWMSGSLFGYVKTHEAYLCPTDIQSPDWSTEPAGVSGPGRSNKLCSYLMNGASCNFGSLPIVTRISDVWSPDCYLMWEVDENLLGPSQPGGFEFNDGSNYPTVPPHGDEGLASYHGNNGSEVVTVSGGVSFVTVPAFQAQSVSRGSGPGGRSLCWWAPNLPFGGGQ